MDALMLRLDFCHLVQVRCAFQHTILAIDMITIPRCGTLVILCVSYIHTYQNYHISTFYSIPSKSGMWQLWQTTKQTMSTCTSIIVIDYLPPRAQDHRCHSSDLNFRKGAEWQNLLLHAASSATSIMALEPFLGVVRKSMKIRSFVFLFLLETPCCLSVWLLAPSYTCSIDMSFLSHHIACPLRKCTSAWSPHSDSCLVCGIFATQVVGWKADFILRMLTCRSAEDCSFSGGPMDCIVIMSFIPEKSGMGQVAFRMATLRNHAFSWTSENKHCYYYSKKLRIAEALDQLSSCNTACSTAYIAYICISLYIVSWCLINNLRFLWIGIVEVETLSYYLVWYTHTHSTASIAQGRPQILGSDMACPPALGAASQPKARQSLASEGHCWDLTSTRRACGSVIDVFMVFMVFIPLSCSQQNQVQVITTHRTWTLCLYYQASYQRKFEM